MHASSSPSSSMAVGDGRTEAAEGGSLVKSFTVIEEDDEAQVQHSNGSSASSPLTSSTCGSGPHEQQQQQQQQHPSQHAHHVDSSTQRVTATIQSSALTTSGQLGGHHPSFPSAMTPHKTPSHLLRVDPATAGTAAVRACGSGVSTTAPRATHALRLQAPSLQTLPSSSSSMPHGEPRQQPLLEGAPPAKRLRLSLTMAAGAGVATASAIPGADVTVEVSAHSGRCDDPTRRGRVLQLVPTAAKQLHNAAVPGALMTAEAHRGDRKLQPTGTEAQPPDSNGGATGSGATAAPRALPSPCDVTGMTGEGASPRPAPLPSAIPGTIITRAGPSPVAVDAGRSQEGVVSPSTATESCARPPPQPPLQLASSSVAAVAAAGSPSGATSSIGGGGFPRLRSLTPQPYAGAGKGSQRRRHRFVNVTLPSAPPSPQTELFQTFQRTVRDVYDVYEKLSEGTYGEVFRGVDKRTGAVVALKRLKMLSMHQGFPQTSLREVIALRHIQLQRERLEARQRQATGPSSAARASTVSNPLAEVAQLCDVLVFDRTRPDIVLVFAYATASLAGLLRRQFIFSPPELAYVMKKLLTAVRKLHDMSIIHRDIKSDNVLITSNGEVQLTDFGLCSIISSNGGGGGTSVTPGRAWRTPSVITLAYRPPEMLLGSTAYDEKVDVWSVGCLLAQLYLFEPPFYRHRVLQQQQQQQQGQPQRTAATELEQLSRITEVLGPLPPARVYHPEACQHMRVLGELEEQGRLAEAGKAAQPANWGKLQSLFEPSFLFQQFHGFRGWFEAEVQRTRHQPQRRPTQACMDVLCAALQLDPQQRPSAAELLRMPYFTTLDDAPLQGTYHRPIAVTPEREEEVRRGFMLKVQRCGDSHTQRRPH